MKTKYFKLFLFPLILCAYAFMYIATTKKDPLIRCDEICQKFHTVDTMIFNSRPYVTSVVQCRDTMLCIGVLDSIPRNWLLLADTACMYMNSVSLLNYWVIIQSHRTGDILVNRKCP